MKRFMYSLLFLFGLPFISFGQQTENLPLILTQDIIPGNFNTEVVDLQNFLYNDPDTRIIPSDVGRYGVETINGIAHFQNKYQRTILGPFGRLATGTAEVMTRFKIATLGIKANPNSLKDAQVRADFQVLLAQTLSRLDEEIARRNNPNYQSNVSFQGGTLSFRGRTVPDDVTIGKPGRYEISETEGFFVSEVGDQYHYQLPKTALQPIENPRTFDDLFNNYDYLQQLQGEIIYTPLDPSLESQTVVVSDAGAAIKKDVSATGVGFPATDNEAFFNSVLGAGVTSATSTTNTQNYTSGLSSSIPLLFASERYGHQYGVSNVHVFGSDLTQNVVGVFYQNGEITEAQTTIVSDSEAYLSIPSNIQSGRVVVGIKDQPHSAIEIFVFNRSSCDRVRSGCISVGIAQTDPSFDEIVFDEEVVITGYGFDTENNTIETPTGMYHNIPSPDKRTVRFTPQYSFTVTDESSEIEIPIVLRVLNRNGLSNVVESEATLEVATSYDAQKKRGDKKSGTQAKNELLSDYLEAFGQNASYESHEGLVSEVRSQFSITAYEQIKQNSSNRVSIGGEVNETFVEAEKKEDEVPPTFLAALQDAVGLGDDKKSFLETIGFTQTAHAALGVPYGGRITASFPCTCSANWYTLVVDPRGVLHPLGIQPGFSRIYAHFNVYTPKVGILGSYAPSTGTCWMYAGAGCYNVPTIGIMDMFPGTGTSIF